MTQLRAGITAAPITLPDLEGNPVTVDPFGPGPKVVVFYKLSCPTCRFGLPFYDRLYRAFEGSGGAIYGIMQTSPEESREFASAHGIRMPQLIDGPPYAASRAYYILNVPTMVVVDGAGRVALASTAFVKEDIRRAAVLLAESAKRPPPEIFTADEDVPAFRPG